VHLSDALTAEQAAAVRTQLGILQGTLLWPDPAVQTLRREFTADPVPENIVWPVITSLESD
jgi:hypothetical protein